MSRESAERWTRIQELFHSALELPPPERAARLARMEEREREEVAALLVAHESDGPITNRSAEEAQTFAQRIGPFQLEDLLGAGGMGAVFSATREGPDFSQRVALKLIRAGFADPRLEEQLKQERRILARLEHPWIARFVDGGTTETGQSWLAMEYVEGVPLAEYCRQKGLPTAARLRLLMQVGEAIGHAHQRLVVHGDLKPSNILVTAGGRPKVLDFGIAELLEPSGAPARSARSAPWLTPAYASPEQIAGKTPTTLSDVYSLGVILYELLAEVRPDERMEPPSARAATPKLRREIDGDLDAIVLKALAQEPGDRYPSVEALSDDMRRWLAGRPIRARKVGLRHRASLFARRHRLAVGAAGLLLLSLVLGIAAVSWQGAVARRERDRARGALQQSEALSAFLIDLFQEADPRRMRGDTTVARALLQRGLTSIDGLKDQPAAQARMLDALGAIEVELGQIEHGRTLLMRGLELRRQVLGPEHPEVALSLTHLGRAFRGQALYVQAESVYRQALAIERADGLPDDDAEAETLSGLGFLMPYLARNPESETFYREALEIRRRVLPPGDPRLDGSRLWLAGALRRRGDDAGAEGLVRLVLASVEARYGPGHIETSEAQVRLADILADRPGAAVEAESLYRRSIAIRRQFEAELRVTHPLSNLATLLGTLDRGPEAERLLREVLVINERMLGKGSGESAAAHWSLAIELHRQHRWPEAEAECKRALEIWKRSAGPDHPVIAVGLSTLSDILEGAGRLQEAERVGREALTLRLRFLPPKHSHIALSMVQVGRLRMRQGSYQEAERLFLEAKSILDSQTGSSHADNQLVFRMLAQVNDSLGRPAEAARYRALAAPTAAPTP